MITLMNQMSITCSKIFLAGSKESLLHFELGHKKIAIIYSFFCNGLIIYCVVGIQSLSPNPMLKAN